MAKPNIDKTLGERACVVGGSVDWYNLCGGQVSTSVRIGNSPVFPREIHVQENGTCVGYKKMYN